MFPAKSEPGSQTILHSCRFACCTRAKGTPGQARSLATVDVDDVETCIARHDGGINILLLHTFDVGHVELVVPGVEITGILNGADPAGRLPCTHSGGLGCCDKQLYADECPVLVGFLAGALPIADVGLVDHPGHRPETAHV